MFEFVLAQTVQSITVPSQMTQSINPMGNNASVMSWSIIQVVISVLGVLVLGHGLITLILNTRHAMAGREDKIKTGPFVKVSGGGSVLGGAMIVKFFEILLGAAIIFGVWSGQILQFIGFTSNTGITILHTVQNSATNAVQGNGSSATNGTGTVGGTTGTTTPVCPSGYVWNGSVCQVAASGTGTTGATGTATITTPGTGTTAP